MTRTSSLSLCFIIFGCAVNSCLAADRILFDRLGPTQATLFISNADGSNERPLTQPGLLDKRRRRCHRQFAALSKSGRTV